MSCITAPCASYFPSPIKMATFAVRFKKCDHQDGFRIIMTFEKGETARDMVNKLHPDSGDSGKYKICVIGFAAGASITTSTSRAENHGFEVEFVLALINLHNG